MKKIISLFITLTLVLCLFAPAGIAAEAKTGTTYYIDSVSGDDANAGTSAQAAWKSLSAHSDFEFMPGDKILLKAGGMYEGLFVTKACGTDENPITLSSYGDIESDGRPVLTTGTTEHDIVFVNASNWIVENLEFTAEYGGGIYAMAINAKEEDIENYIASRKADHLFGDYLLNQPEEPEVPEEPGEEKGFLEKVRETIESIPDSIKGTLEGIKGTVEDLLDYIDEEPCEPLFDPSLPEELICENLTFRNLVFHDLNNNRDADVIYSSTYRPMFFNTSGQGTKFVNVKVQNVEMYNCALGIQVKGNNIEERKEFFISPEKSYNRDFLFENISFTDIGYDALIIGAVKGCLVRNCSAINTCIHNDGYTAPIWMHWCDDVTVENCEIAGTQNTYDGMTVDFDGWTTNSTYQYIYSHDNSCFIKSNTFDKTTSNSGNTVRYCLSVNDNRTFNMMSFVNMSKKYDFSDHAWSMKGLKFYNNTVINCAPTVFGIISGATVENNIFVGNEYISSLSLILGVNNKFRNNCFYYMPVPVGAVGNYVCDPGFAGSDTGDKNSFMLAKDSRLIGKGIRVEDNMGEHDFFGNALTDTHNIGCYEGAGETEKSVRTLRYFPIIRAIIDFFRSLFIR